MTGQLDRFEIADGLRHHAQLPRRPHQLVHPALPGPVLGRRVGSVTGGLRHLVHRARGGHPDGCAAAARRPREIWRGRPVAARCTCRTGPTRRLPGRPRPCRGMDPSPGGVLDRVRAAQGRSVARRLPLSTLTVVASARSRSSASSGSSPTRSTSSPSSSSTSGPRGGRVWRLAPPHRQRPSGRPAARQGRPDRDPRLEERDWSVAEDGSVVAGGIALVEGEYALETVVAESAGDSHTHAVAMLPTGGFVVLDTTVTPELATEGWPATHPARSSRPAATPGSTSATGSRSRWPAPKPCSGRRTSTASCSWPRRFAEHLGVEPRRGPLDE